MEWAFSPWYPIILPQTGLTWFNHNRGHEVRWWNRLKVNILSLIPHHSFLEPSDVIQPLPSNVDLVKLFCQLWWDSIWWLAFTCDSHSAVSYLWYFRLNTTTAAESDDKEKNQQLWALSYSDTLYRPVSFILLQILSFSFESTEGYWIEKWRNSLLPISQLWWCWWRNPQSKQEQISVARQNVCSIPSSSKFKMTFTPVSL